GIFLSFDAGRDHHGGSAIAHHIVDLAAQAAFVDLKIGSKRRQRRNKQSGLWHGGVLLGTRTASCPAGHCLGICALAITAPHLAISDRMRASSSAGVEARVSMPRSSARFFSAGSANTSCSAALSVSMISFGVP